VTLHCCAGVAVWQCAPLLAPKQSMGSAGSQLHANQLASNEANDTDDAHALRPPSQQQPPQPLPQQQHQCRDDDASDVVRNSGGAHGRQRCLQRDLEARLQRCMDAEDSRVKELTEGVLYGLLPTLLTAVLPPAEDAKLDERHCRVCLLGAGYMDACPVVLFGACNPQTHPCPRRTCGPLAVPLRRPLQAQHCLLQPS
jgi:hypothetical protein